MRKALYVVVALSMACVLPALLLYLTYILQPMLRTGDAAMTPMLWVFYVLGWLMALVFAFAAGAAVRSRLKD